jgi:hypothetical protein
LKCMLFGGSWSLAADGRSRVGEDSKIDVLRP